MTKEKEKEETKKTAIEKGKSHGRGTIKRKHNYKVDKSK